MRDKKIKGYMTVEAGFILPWVLFIFVFLIYVSFYLYDKCVLFQDAYTVCFRGSIQKEEKEALPYVREHLKEQFGEKYFGTDGVQGSADRKGKKIMVYGSCSVRVPAGHFLTMAQKEGWRIETTAGARIMNPTRLIRRYRMAESVLK